MTEDANTDKNTEQVDTQNSVSKSTTYDTVKKWCDDNETDILIYSGSIGSDNSNSHLSERFVDLVLSKQNKRKNCLLFLTSNGGIADWAYKIAAVLKKEYEKHDVVVCGYCKSAATLISLGAHSLFFAPKGELGPLDVQTSKKDDFFGRQSPLDIFQAQELVSSWTLNFFNKSFSRVLGMGRGILSMEVASNIANKLAESLYAPIMGKINPIEVGEIYRSMNVAKGYGEIIKSNNVKTETLEKLVVAYPCHSFVIDKKQAEDLFERVYEINDIQKLIYEYDAAFIKHILEKPFENPGFTVDMIDFLQPNKK